MTTNKRFLPTPAAFLYACIACLLIAGLSSRNAAAQNLLPNPSFELRDSCPDGWHEGFSFISNGPLFASSWYMPSAGTADYYNACAPNPPIPGSLWVSVPLSSFGYQEPKTGSAYAGFFVGTLGSEYVETPLITPTIANHRYFIGYWLSVADLSFGACSSFGAYVSTDSLELEMVSLLDMFVPQVESPAGTIYADSIGWQKVAGVYTSPGNERWLTIGNFRSLNDQDTMRFMQDMGFGVGMWYYFCDDVCMLDLDGTPDQFSVTEYSLCNVDNITLSGRPGRDNYYWSNGSEDSTIVISTPGVYWVNSVNLNNCTFISDTFIVTGSGALVPFRLGQDIDLCQTRSVTLDAYDQRFDTYVWNTGATTPQIEVAVPGTYQVTLSSSCATAVGEINVRLDEQCACIFVPNAFSPNDDGVNDLFLATPQCAISAYQLQIFNRFGELIYTSAAPLSGWDGRYKGKDCDAGTYFFQIKYLLQHATEAKELKGDITLIR